MYGGVGGAEPRGSPLSRFPETPMIEPKSRGVLGPPLSRWTTAVGWSAHQFNTRLLSGLSSENVGTSISNRSPLSLTIW